MVGSGFRVQGLEFVGFQLGLRTLSVPRKGIIWQFPHDRFRSEYMELSLGLRLQVHAGNHEILFPIAVNIGSAGDAEVPWVVFSHMKPGLTRKSEAHTFLAKSSSPEHGGSAGSATLPAVAVCGEQRLSENLILNFTTSTSPTKMWRG
mmetsp:Transcript_38680/g.60320  ORF Transcript_38680/g.60320 Transcript_38680/m.60320 type:complete len:148 (+) Transcript_38680:54-497(+)